IRRAGSLPAKYILILPFVFLSLFGSLKTGVSLTLLIPALFLLGVSAYGLGAREEISFDGKHLIRRRGIWGLRHERRVPLDRIESFSVTLTRDAAPSFHRRRFPTGGAYVKALRAGGEPLRIGSGLGHGDEAMAWLGRRVA